MGCLAIMRLSILEILRRKEIYIAIFLVFLLALWMQCMNPAASGASRFARDIVMQVIWLTSFALAAPLAARQITSDMEQKTVYLLISRPIHRWKYVFGRAGGAALASIICFASFYVILQAMLVLKGTSSLADASMWQAFGLQIAALVMLCSISVFFSTLGSSMGAVTFSMILLVLMTYGGPSMLHRIEAMSGFWRNIAWAGYLFMPHFEFFSMSQRVVHGWGALPVILFMQILFYGICYALFTTAFAAYVFKRKWL